MIKELIYEKRNINNFGILGKGSSLSFIKKYHSKFQSCYVLSDFDEELEINKKYLINKKIIHFANKDSLSILKRSTYNKFNIKNVQLSTRFSFSSLRLFSTYLKYKLRKPGLKIYLLDSMALKYNQDFSNEYKNKFPNTGILSILYAIDYISPKNLWIFGIDFYTTSYSTEQKNQPPISLKTQNEKIKRLKLIEILHKKMSQSPHINFHVCSFYPNWPDLPNIKIYHN